MTKNYRKKFSKSIDLFNYTQYIISIKTTIYGGCEIMRNLFNRFRSAETLQAFISKSSFNMSDIYEHLELAHKLNRKYLCILIGEDGNEALFSFSYKNRLLNLVKLFCGGEYDDKKIKSVKYFDTVITEEDDEDDED